MKVPNFNQLPPHIRNNPTQKRWIINPRDVQQKEELRVRKWAHSVMKKHEHRFKPDVPERKVIAWDMVKPEDIDIKVLYPWPSLNWVIYKEKGLWTIMLRSFQKLLAKVTFVKI